LKSLEIAVCGAGPAGLAAALLLHRAGHRITLFERFDTPQPLGSGLILQPTGLTVLHALGLLDDIIERGSRIHRLVGADASSGRTVLDVRYAANRRSSRFGLAVHRAALFGVLHRAVTAAGIAIETSCEITGLEQGASGARLLMEEGRHAGPFDLVVDALGARSKLRGICEGAREAVELHYGAFWASLDWVGEGFVPDALSQRYRRANVMIGVMPIGSIEPGDRQKAAFFWSLKPATADAVRAAGLDRWKAEVEALWPQTRAYLDQIETFDQLALARYGHHTLARPASRRLAVIGDAAHSTSPQLGQGANMALLDAVALAHALATAPDTETALSAYCRARRLHVRLFQALSLALTPFYQSDSRFLPFLRDTLVATVAKVPPAPAIMASMVAGMTLDPFSHIGLQEPDWEQLVRRQPATEKVLADGTG
jgi:2-polyprenyl-6-methoxyphenol hydroxylase-like FAD-dependent oxidoreductase